MSIDGRARRRTLLGVGLGLLLALGGATAVLALTKTGFEFWDGDSQGSMSTPDWNDVYAGTGAFDATSFTFDPDYTKEASLFTQGSKDVLDIPEWAWRTVGQPPDKTDLLHVMSAKDGDMLYFAADRYANNGDTKVGFWFLQDDVSYKYDTSTFTGAHVDGDIMIESTFTNGGRIDTIRVYEWVGGALVEQGVAGGDCKDADISSFDVCATNNSGNFSPAWEYSQKRANKLPAGTFIEGALDLTALYGAEVPCFGSFLAETRSAGSSIYSELKDLVLADFDTCGTLTVQKLRNAGSPNDEFDFTTGGTLTPDTFSLYGATSAGSVGAANRQVFTRLEPGTYTVTELEPAEPWVLTGIVCTGGTSSTDGMYTATVTIAGNEDVVCTFSNFYNVVTTRTQGFWQTHPNLAAGQWGASRTMCGLTVSSTAGTGTDQLMGGFWANVSSKADGTKRSALNKAKMTLLQQLLAAKINATKWPPSQTILDRIALAESRFCTSTSTHDVNSSASAMGAYNESGDTGIWSPGERATAVDARSRADVGFWDYLGK